jgi:hypothetical protein
MRREALLVIVLIAVCATTYAQQPPPKPFPQPAQPRSAPTQQTKPAAPATAPIPAKPSPPTGGPDAKTLGVPIYPTAQFITSYDAGRGQRFYLFGATVPFAEMVNYYRTTLKTRGEVLFETPPTHQFEIGRFREETMAFPPTVTIKDFTWGGSPGYPNKRGAQPDRFPTIIQIVPAPVPE